MLARIGRPAKPALLEVLKDERSYVRVLAAASLAEMRDKSVIPRLEEADRRTHYVNLGEELSCEICEAIRQLKSK